MGLVKHKPFVGFIVLASAFLRGRFDLDRFPLRSQVPQISFVPSGCWANLTRPDQFLQEHLMKHWVDKNQKGMVHHYISETSIQNYIFIYWNVLNLWKMVSLDGLISIYLRTSFLGTLILTQIWVSSLKFYRRGSLHSAYLHFLQSFSSTKP